MARPLHQKLVLILLLTVCTNIRVDAAKPSKTLLPDTTKAYVSVPDVDFLRKHWNETQLGKLVADPDMEPFVKDLQRQIRDKLSQTNTRLGISWEDLEGVYGGEVCAALLQPWDAEAAQGRLDAAVAEAVAKAEATGKKPEAIEAAKNDASAKAMESLDAERRLQAAVVLLVDVTGHLAEARDLLAKIAKNQVEKGAQQESLQVGGVDVVKFILPLQEGQKVAGTAFYCIHEDQLVTTDRQDVLAGIISRFAEDGTGLLAHSTAFAETERAADKAFGETIPHVHWFLEPFGYVEILRAYNGGRKRRGANILRVLQKQGFTSIQGLGGKVALKTDEHDVRYHSLFYAPAAKRKPGDLARTKYNRAARMLDFPNTDGLLPQSWIPRGLATHLTFNWKMKEAFWYAETLVNELAGDEVFEDVIKNIELDPHGPQIHVEKEFTQHLGERATLISDYRLPITPKSERIMVAIEVTDAATVMKTVNKAMEKDPAAKKRIHEGHVIWELKNEGAEAPEVKIEGFDDGFGFDEPMAVAEEEDKPFIPNSAVTVANGHLLIASHVDYIVEVLQAPAEADSLRNAADYGAMAKVLKKLGAGSDSFQLFTRTDEAYRVTYELMRAGKMPESESVLGKLLNRMFASDEDEEEELREQQIDGSQMPEYQIVRRYLGPAGFYVRTVDEGWAVSGCLLTKDLKPAVAADN
ncbi:MAG: hypothetical protein CMJ64_25130 [Planctomycetaceae bacterium]|nr:hypothetical protein [Planctomycetaceae bacterium]